jgi:hypothetical protein
MITGTTLSYWLSPALTGAYRLAPYTSVRGMVQLAAMAVWQKSFEHYYLVTEHMLKNESLRLYQIEDKYPLLTYCDTCAHMFVAIGMRETGYEFIGGDYYPARYPPVTFNFRKVFESDGEKVDLLVDELMSLIKAVNEIEENGLLKLCRATLEPRLTSTSNRIREVLPDCELCPFRLLVFLQFCAHLNVGLTACKNLRNILYPVAGAASHCHIVGNGFKDSAIDEICSFLQSEMSTPSRIVFMDEIEPMLCEASTQHRRWEGKDIFIKGQDLFRLDEHGTPWVKVFRSMTWSRVVYRKEPIDQDY